MGIRWRVTQYDSANDRLKHTETFRFKVVAIIVAWVMAGRGHGGQEFYTRIRREEPKP